MITSTQNPQIKLVHSLQNRARTRRKEGKIVLEGLRLVNDAVQQGHTPDVIYHTPEITADLPNSLPVSTEVMRYMSDTENPQGIIGVFPMPQVNLPKKPARVLILDAIRDPGNMGTILRTAGAAGAQGVLLSPDCVDSYNPKVLRAGMGAHFRLPIATLDWPQIIEYTQSLTVYLADSDGDHRYDQIDWNTNWALIVANEAHGAGEQATQLAARRVYIPMAAATESINAAMAASVILFEAQRQRS